MTSCRVPPRARGTGLVLTPRLLLGSMAAEHRSQEASLLPRGYSLKWLRDPNTAAVF